MSETADLVSQVLCWNAVHASATIVVNLGTVSRADYHPESAKASDLSCVPVPLYVPRFPWKARLSFLRNVAVILYFIPNRPSERCLNNIPLYFVQSRRKCERYSLNYGFAIGCTVRAVNAPYFHYERSCSPPSNRGCQMSSVQRDTHPDCYSSRPIRLSSLYETDSRYPQLHLPLGANRHMRCLCYYRRKDKGVRLVFPYLRRIPICAAFARVLGHPCAGLISACSIRN